jgi:alcohol dehydrogenase
VRASVEACGICHTDHNVPRSDFGDGPFPLTPGHEVAGRIP